MVYGIATRRRLKWFVVLSNTMFSSVELAFSSDSSESDNEDSRLCRRNMRDASNVLELPENQFVANFRVNKEVFRVLLDEMAPKLKTSYKTTRILPTTTLATFLSFVATGGYQASIGKEWSSSMCKSQVCKIIEECLNIFEETLCCKWIVLAKSVEKENETKESFYNRGGIPGVVGCVDGTHIRIKSPGPNLIHLYHNYKGFYSMNVMAICDHNMVISFVDARHPGRNHDAFVWEHSAAHSYFRSNHLNGKTNTWLLGDGGYKLQPYLMKPYRNPIAPHETLFNDKLCKLRNVIERCFGVLKNRFRCLIGSRGLHYSPAKVTQIVNVCCALHNMCIFYKNNWAELDCTSTSGNNEVDEEAEEDHSENMAAANSIRDRIARSF